jgi:hypothetical protein
MQRNAIIFHGTGGSLDICWYRWLGGRLTERGVPLRWSGSGAAATIGRCSNPCKHRRTGRAGNVGA